MKALILAAGRGTRISRYLSGNPKCTVDIGNQCLIDYTVSLLKKKGIQDIALALGYKQNIIREKLSHHTNIIYYGNPFFDITNSIASVWFSREFLESKEDILLINGDVYMEEAVLDQIMDSKQNPVLFSDETRKEEADYKFYYKDNILLKYGKELTGTDITGEYIGIARINADFLPTFLKQMNQMVENQTHSVWWENVLYELSSSQSVFVEDIEGKFWAEVDYIEDYQRILEYRKRDTLHV